MARLDYDLDNFSGTNSRRTRYDIFVNGVLKFHDVTDRDCDTLCDRLERQYSQYITDFELEVKEL